MVVKRSSTNSGDSETARVTWLIMRCEGLEGLNLAREVLSYCTASEAFDGVSVQASWRGPQGRMFAWFVWSLSSLSRMMETQDKVRKEKEAEAEREKEITKKYKVH